MVKSSISNRIVVKIGSSLITNNGKNINKKLLGTLAYQISLIRENSTKVVIVSSGAIAKGMKILNMRSRPKALYQLQAAASVGQIGLIEAYQTCFKRFNIITSQILLTQADLKNRTRYLNAKSTILELLNLNILPIINENDSVSTDEIKFGDNDTLASLVTNLINADKLIILTDQNGVFTSDPRLKKEAKIIKEIFSDDPKLDRASSDTPGTKIGSGGMKTKILAARKAALSGSKTVIAHGNLRNVLLKIVNGENVGTKIKPKRASINARKQWLVNNFTTKGTITLDEGATKAIKKFGKSVLPVGVLEVDGKFFRGDLVVCMDQKKNKIATGLINYSSSETKKILGSSTLNISEKIGYIDEPELIHRDNLMIL